MDAYRCPELRNSKYFEVTLFLFYRYFYHMETSVILKDLKRVHKQYQNLDSFQTS